MRKKMLSVLSVGLSLALLVNLTPDIPLSVQAEQSGEEYHESFPVDYDPNEGYIQYGHTGNVGMMPENDVNNIYDKDDNVVYFPSDAIKLKDENGQLLFPDYDSEASLRTVTENKCI